ncbi:run domain Beclin-1-interacting and cysteine-rich domain-containing protein-like [Anneissia japonica]|uniref:run domain Beclin-1-interacting and cysteine-rich domain-containing protein-like n=1 Tax=Anneissia japonica TaxID=1529436 RepID=UPI0014255FA8|nr:run domain Beclin-1-interacting and cysteine-rich domain-containing protein-like [Anneissia japonica]
MASSMIKEEFDGDPGGRDTLQELLLTLKSTVEGLLASHSTYVWSTYGGLTRLCNAVNKILRHQLRQNQTLFTNLDDHWVFIKRLRTLNPVLAPSIDQISRQAVEQGCVKGELWVKISLENLSLSSQLKQLVENEEHAQLCYYDSAFIRSPPHFLALYLCLQAVERNDISVLADIDPSLLRKQKLCHTRSASLPGGAPFYKTMPIMQRKPSCSEMTPPHFTSPKTESILTTSGEHALPSPPSADSLGERRTSAKDALTFVLQGSSSRNNDKMTQITHVATDPLLNQSFLPGELDGRLEQSPLMNDNDKKSDGRTKKKGICDCKTNAAIDSEWRSEMEAALVHGGGKAYCRLCGKKLKLRNDTNLVRRNSSRSSLLSSSSTLPPQNNQLFGDDDDVKPQMVAHKKKRRTLQKMNSVSSTNLDVMGEDELDGSVFSLPSSVEHRTESLLEEGSFSVSPVTDCYFPRPVEGQSLLSFLSSKDFKKCPELDRENAHFCISEAIIAAVEQIKCRSLTGNGSDHESDGSDEEIQELKQRIRIRRKERHSQNVRPKYLLSDGESKTETTTTSSSGENSPAESLDDSEHFESSCASSEDELTDKSSNMVSMATTGLSGSMASLYSDADVRRGVVAATRLVPAVPSVTAEAVALSLLQKFSEKHLPAASDLAWMVTEHDAPQALLPLPKSVPISPDQADNINTSSLTGKNTRIRGNLDWAPPRAQIVFNVHQTQKRKVVMMKQNQRCAGCGMKVEVGYQKRLRYCHYLGKYFCHCCHNNSTAVIPGRILEKWDFRKYSVSNFALELLRKMHNDALFNVHDRNAQLYRRINALEQSRELRLQLYHLKDFIKTCRIGQSLLPTLEQYPKHLYTDIHIFSIHDLLKVKSGELVEELKVLVEDIKNHVKQCQLCQARGFICELCNKETDIIFPFELSKTHQCQDCWACYHISCFQTTKVCKKCERIKARKSGLASSSRQPQEPAKVTVR